MLALPEKNEWRRLMDEWKPSSAYDKPLTSTQIYLSREVLLLSSSFQNIYHITNIFDRT